MAERYAHGHYVMRPAFDLSVAVCLATAIAQVLPGDAQEFDQPNESLPGRIFVLGEEILPPWRFTGVGEDTLRLNGIPFQPVRSNFVPPPPIVSELDARRSALRESAFKVTRTIGPRDERNRAMARFYETSDLVDSVVMGEPENASGFSIYWKGDPDGEAAPFWIDGGRSWDGPVETDPASGHEVAIRHFWHAMQNGRLIVLVRHGWMMSCTGERSERTIEVMRSVRAGLDVSDSTIATSCFRHRGIVEEFRKYMTPAPG